MLVVSKFGCVVAVQRLSIVVNNLDAFAIQNCRLCTTEGNGMGFEIF